MKAKIIYMNPEMEKLSKKHPSDAGIDLQIVFPNKGMAALRPGHVTTFKTGIKLDIPEGYGAYILPRSSASKAGLTVCTGTIDSGYQGEIRVIVANYTDKFITIRHLERIAQLVPFKVPEVEFEEVTSFDEVSPRGENGFGSTGKF